MKDLWHYLATASKPILLYGMGNGADKIIKYAEKYSINLSGVFVSDGFVRDKSFHGMKITDYSTAKETFGDMIVLVSFGTALEDVLENIKRISREQELYVPDVPVYGDNLFTLDFAIKHKEELEFVYSRLADDISKKCFENTVLYKITGKAEYLFDCETQRSEIFKILKAENIKSFIDLGAYNGDTVCELYGISQLLCNITAVEPDKRSFRKLCENTKHIPFCSNVFACASDKDGTVYFADKKGRGSALSASGTEVKSICVDSITAESKVDYIKFDVEGNELLAIEGAKNTISRHKPKMCIAAYHRSEDLFTLPTKILSLCSDYKIYMRHTPCLPAWDTDFIFV